MKWLRNWIFKVWKITIISDSDIWSTRNNNINIDYVDLKWEQQFNRLIIWYDDGDHEELFYRINEDGYLLLSLNAQLTQYTAYRPVDHTHPLEANKATQKSRHNDSAVAIKSISRAVGVGHQQGK